MLAEGEIPDEIVVAADRRRLTLVWRRKADVVLSSADLRSACRCAWCTRDRVLGTFDEAFPHVSLSGVELLGTHGLHLKFSDGHERGIFPWPYLRDLGASLDLPRGERSPAAASPDP